MSSISTIGAIGEESTLTQSALAEEEEGPTNSLLFLKEKLNSSMKEIENLNSVISSKNKEIVQLKCRNEQDKEFEEKLLQMEKKYQKTSTELKELKELQLLKEKEVQTKYIEKSLHQKALIENTAKINYLTSENQRLNSLITEKLGMFQDKENFHLLCETLESQKKELTEKLEIQTQRSVNLESDIGEMTREIGEWKKKYDELEKEKLNVQGQLEKKNTELGIMRQTNEEKDQQLKDLATLRHKLEESHKEKSKQTHLLEEKEKEFEKLKLKFEDMENKEAEVEYLKERIEVTLQENGELHKAVMEKSFEIEELASKLTDWKEKIEKISELEKRVSQLNYDNDELAFKLDQKSQALEKANESFEKLYSESSELQAMVEYLTQENDELNAAVMKSVEMISDLKNLVLKKEEEESKVLDFGKE